MVDFRYHLVSLISVFLALAIGVVLGAGPLQTPIASGLSGQLETLRAEQAAVAADVEAARLEIGNRNAWIDTITKDALAGSMTGRTVALVLFPDTRGEDVQSITDLLEQAGATVNQTVTLAEGWSDMSMAQYRNSLSSAVLSHLTTQQTSDQTSAGILAAGLLEILTVANDEATVLRELYTDEQMPLVSFSQEPAQSEAILVIGPLAEQADENGQAPSAPSPTHASPSASTTTHNGQGKPQPAGDEQEGPTRDVNMLTALAGAIAQAPSSGVVLGSGTEAGDMVTAARENQVAVTTVDGVGTSMGNSSAVLALVSADRTARAFGNQTGAQTLVPPLPGKREQTRD